MVRRYDEPIEVRETHDVSRAASPDAVAVPDSVFDSGPHPDAFVWRGRLYVVRAVLDRWKERRPWWRDVHDQHAQPGQHGDVLTDAREQLVWRVEASAGRLASVGVFDLGLTPERQWTLLRVTD